MRSANYQRRKGRPASPKDLDFTVDSDWVSSDFLRSDLRVDEARHLVFATDSQLDLLKTVSMLYCDATFKVVSPPFYQMSSVHALLENDSFQAVKQIPLMFALMSRRRCFS